MGLSSEQILARTGWSRSVGGSNPYQTLWARGAHSRASAEADISAQILHELPSARNCTYVLPRRDFALGLKVGQGQSGEARTADRHLGFRSEEMGRLKEQVVRALEAQALDPKQLNLILGDKIRHFGEEGKKRGVTTSLPLALGALQSEGRIRRIPVGGRLDQQRYQYTVWTDNPLAGFRLTTDEAFAALAAQYFGWVGAATLSQFRTFAGLGVAAAKSAVSGLDLVPIESGSETLIRDGERQAFQDFEPSGTPQVKFLSSLDSIISLRSDLLSLIDEADMAHTMLSGIRGARPRLAKDLGGNVVLDRGRIVGLWEFDTFAQQVIWKSFGADDEAIREEAELAQAWIRTDLGDVRSFSLDSPESRKPRLASLRGI